MEFDDLAVDLTFDVSCFNKRVEKADFDAYISRLPAQRMFCTM
ncbi:MAG: hypothetical protein ABI347_03125 [Nitrososphaera sp.]|jgi:hypothetical protein